MKLIQFIKDAIQEFRHITWPTSAQLRKHTIIALTFVLVFSGVMAALDFAFGTTYTELTKNIQPKPSALNQNPTRSTTTSAANPERTTLTGEGTNGSNIKILDDKGNPITGDDVKITPGNATAPAPATTPANPNTNK